jgi:hypothetical protein
MMYYIRHGDEVLGEVEACSPFRASCEVVCASSPDGSVLVELASGTIVARKTDAVGGLLGWRFSLALDFGDEAAA